MTKTEKRIIWIFILIVVFVILKSGGCRKMYEAYTATSDPVTDLSEYSLDNFNGDIE
jgi:hypothetical protein